MSAAPTPPSPAWQRELLARLPEPLRRDPKKSAILAGLGVLMAGVLLKQFVLSAGPADAEAATLAATPAPLLSLAGSAAAASSSSQSRVLAEANPVERWLLEPVRPLDRNVFEFRGEFFPNVNVAGSSAAAAAAGSAATVVEDELFWDRLAKSIASRADQRKQRQIRVENLQLAAGRLRVQSTILGANPRVLIAGKMHRVGDAVEAEASTAGGGATLAFRILRIDGRRIVLEREGVKLELPMGATRARVIVEDEAPAAAAGAETVR